MISKLSTVSIVRCSSYQADHLSNALRLALDHLGDIGSYVRPGQRVLVKVNHLSPPSPPERGIVTHPALIEQVLMILLEHGALVRVGDDVDPNQGDAFAISGLRQVCRKLGVELINFREEGFQEVHIPSGEVLRHTYLAKAVLEAEVVINLPKFKTHSLTAFTGAIKNMYGCLPEGLRVKYHYQFQNRERFNTLLVDLFSAIRPQLHIMDAVVGMEGDGPGNGKTRHIGLILASLDAVALDTASVYLAGIDPAMVYYLKKADDRQLGIYNLERISILGESLNVVRIPDFKTDSVPLRLMKRWMPDFLFRALCRQFESFPHIISSQCVGCRACASICPGGAIRIDKDKAKIESRQCIACMCCHEVCRFKAIIARKRLIARIISALIRRLRSY